MQARVNFRQEESQIGSFLLLHLPASNFLKCFAALRSRERR